MEQSFVSNEPSWTEFEYIKLCPQSPEGYSANDQVLLPMLEGRMDCVAPPAPEPAAEEELPAEARGRGEAAQPPGAPPARPTRVSTSPPGSPGAAATGTVASVAAAREAYLARCCAMRTAPVTKLLKPDATPDTIDLTHRGLGNRGAVALATFVAASAPLRALRLADNNLAREGAEALFNAVARHGAIAELHLADNAVGAALPRLAAAMCAGGRALEVLDLSGNRLGDGGAAELGRALAGAPRVQQLALGNNAIGDAGLDALLDALCAGGAPALAVLDLRWNRLHAPAPLARALQHPALALQHLDLSWNKLGAPGALALAASLRGSALRTLLLGHCDVPAEAALPLARALQEAGCALEELVLSGNPLGQDGARTLLGGVRAESRLRRIELRGCGLHAAGDIPAAVVAPPAGGALDGADNVPLLRELCPDLLGALALPPPPKPKAPRPAAPKDAAEAARCLPLPARRRRPAALPRARGPRGAATHARGAARDRPGKEQGWIGLGKTPRAQQGAPGARPHGKAKTPLGMSGNSAAPPPQSQPRRPAREGRLPAAPRALGTIAEAPPAPRRPDTARAGAGAGGRGAGSAGTRPASAKPAVAMARRRASLGAGAAALAAPARAAAR